MSLEKRPIPPWVSEEEELLEELEEEDWDDEDS